MKTDIMKRGAQASKGVPMTRPVVFASVM